MRMQISGDYAEDFSADPTDHAWFMRNGWQMKSRKFGSLRAGDLLRTVIEGDTDDPTIEFLLPVTKVSIARSLILLLALLFCSAAEAKTYTWGISGSFNPTKDAGVTNAMLKPYIAQGFADFTYVSGHVFQESGSPQITVVSRNLGAGVAASIDRGSSQIILSTSFSFSQYTARQAIMHELHHLIWASGNEAHPEINRLYFEVALPARPNPLPAPTPTPPPGPKPPKPDGEKVTAIKAWFAEFGLTPTAEQITDWKKQIEKLGKAKAYAEFKARQVVKSWFQGAGQPKPTKDQLLTWSARLLKDGEEKTRAAFVKKFPMPVAVKGQQVDELPCGIGEE